MAGAGDCPLGTEPQSAQPQGPQGPLVTLQSPTESACCELMAGATGTWLTSSFLCVPV